MADPRVQQARVAIEAMRERLRIRRLPDRVAPYAIADSDVEIVVEAGQALVDRVAALETALRFVRPEFAQADNVESWHWGHVKRGEPYAEDCGLCIIDAALAGSGTEPAQEQPTAPCYVCGHPVAEGEGWRRDSKTWCPDHRPVWSHD